MTPYSKTSYVDVVYEMKNDKAKGQPLMAYIRQ